MNYKLTKNVNIQRNIKNCKQKM